MTETGFSAELLRFISTTVPTYPAAELLVFLTRDPGRSWTAEDLAQVIPLATLTNEALGDYLAHFERSGLLRRSADGYRYEPASEALRAAVAALVEAYDHRPVTLVRVVYTIATAKIQSFADAFKLKRDRS